ncbi:MAG TPA: glycoside hydrolase family 15 protein [Candidatus Limnocylindrales bacterium]|nr:glycoside hydrolase family 15 protein [Candidatus Limnocylindrales bacterium]
MANLPVSGAHLGPAPGAPGIGPTWASSAKDAIGTSHFASRVWFTIGRGILNEVYWPRVDRPQTRDLGFIVADDQGFWSEVKRDAEREITQAEPGVPAIRVTHRHPSYELIQRICADDHSDVVRIEVRLGDRRSHAAAPLRLYALLAPHVGFSGLHNRAWAGDYKGRPMLFAQKGSTSLALAADPRPDRLSVGYVGASDGWQDFAQNGRMTWTYDSTDEGNVAGLMELTLDHDIGQLALGFGQRPEEAALQASASLAAEFDKTWREYIGHWRDFIAHLGACPEGVSTADHELYLTSAAVLRCHADRTSPGAIVASLSIPWGNAGNDLGGYHLVWSRDLVESAGALVALGAHASARRTLAYLVASQEPDGSWPQNQWVDGIAYWSGRQLDEAAYPILLAGALRQHGAAHMHGLGEEGVATFEHLLTEEALDRMVELAAGFIARSGPATGQDRWEENAGLTPSTLAPVVAALVVAAEHLPARAAAYARELADDWNASIEDWTYVAGSRLAREHGVDGHYIRIASPDVLAGAPVASPVPVRNRPPAASMVPADEMVGTDFLALVRFGLRRADDPRILATLSVADGELRVETPAGPVWRRYSGDGYGEHEDGSPFDGTGVGRGWPLLVGERGHYELEAGRDARPYLDAIRAMGSMGGMLPEQVWDTEPIPARGLAPGRPSGSAMPLAWAHAEYVKLVRSIGLGHPIDRPEACWMRYAGVPPTATRATWRFDAARPAMTARRTLRLEVLAPTRVRWSTDDWATFADLDAEETGLGVWIADIPGSATLDAGEAVDFTFFWPEAARWEGRNFRVVVAG